MRYQIQIGNDPIEIEASDKTNALIALSHYIEKHPDKKITLTYNGCNHAAASTKPE